MAISIDTVYQKVLAFANKEQRGYVTPQEYNLFADQAQKEIFEQYFYDLSQFSKIHGENSEYVDITTNINEKLSIFEKEATITTNTIVATDLYRLGSVYSSSNIIVEEVQPDEIINLNLSPLTAPTANRPVYVRKTLTTIETHGIISASSCSYTRAPASPYFGYVVVGGKAMYDPGTTINFELHKAEEPELVYKILKFAGLSMRKDDLAKGGQGLESLQVQQEKQ